MKLYPPNIEGTIPAFSGSVLVVPFIMNKTVSKNNIKNFSLKLKTVQSNVLVKVATSSHFNFDTMEAYFTITGLKIGQYYKAQIAYIDNDGIVGYYSTIGVVKYTSAPTVLINGLETNKINISSYRYLGVYSQKEQDVTEKVYSYKFDIMDSNGNLFASSGENIHNSFQDTEVFESTDSFSASKELDLNQTYYIQYHITTTNKMRISSPRYRIMQRNSINPDIDAELIASLNQENGYINLTLVGNKDDSDLEIAATGAFLITRASSKDNYGSWDNILKFVLHGQQPSRWLWKDYTVEHGQTYKYALQQYNDYDLYSNRILSNDIYVQFEDSFLYDGEKQLKIKYNPKVSSFKTNTQETKVDTIGSQYPFIFKNGNISYKEFPLSGLISYQMDEENLFISEANLKLLEITTNLTNENIASERIFKLKVLEFLNDGKPKVFRSPTEGNYIVRLMNSSLAPVDTLGRMLHTFSCTAYEIASFTYEELSNYNFIQVVDPSTVQMRWETIPLVTTDDNGNVSYVEAGKKLNNHIAITVRFQDMMPGDLVLLDHKSIAIGITGSYYVDTGTSIENIQLATPGEHQGQIVYSYTSQAQNKFDTITGMDVEDIPLVQYIGEHNVFDSLEDIKFELEGFYLLQFAKRNIVEAYTDNENIHIWTTSDKTEYLTIFNPFNMYYIKNTDKNPSIDDYIIDGNTLEKIDLSNYSNTIYINNSPIDLTETSMHIVRGPKGIKSIKTSNGIMAEFSVQRKELFYLTEETGATKKAKEDYQLALNRLLDIIYGVYDTNLQHRIGVNIQEDYLGNVNLYNEALNEALTQKDSAYSKYIEVLSAALEEVSE